jgi:hypothetical protein
MVPSANGLQVSDEKYSAVLSSGPEGLVVRFKGTVSTPNPSVLLNPFVDSVHEQLAKGRHAVVMVDFRELEFCNSSGFKAFIHWLERIREMPKEAQYRLRFTLNPARKWQRTSLLALSCFAPDKVEAV